MAQIPEEVFKEVLENGVERYVLTCPVCGAELANIYRAGVAYQFYPSGCCEHFKWEVVGNGCLENPSAEICRGTEELVKKAVRIYYSGTSVYLLIPRS